MFKFGTGLQRLPPALALILSLTACGGAQSTSTLPRPDNFQDNRSIHELLPPNARASLFWDLGALRGSAMYSEIKEDLDSWGAALASSPESAEGITAPDGDAPSSDFGAYWELADSVDWMYVAFAYESDGDLDDVSALTFYGAHLSPDQVKMILRATEEFTAEADVPDWLAEAQPNETPPPPVGAPSVEIAEVERDGHTIFQFGDWGLTELASGVWVMGELLAVNQVLTRLTREAGMRTEGRVVAVEQAMGAFSHHLSLAITEPNALAGDDIDVAEQLAENPELRMLSRMRAIGITADLDSGVHVRAMVDWPDRLTATGYRVMADQQLESLQEDGPPLFGLARLLRSHTMEQRENRVWHDIDLSQADSMYFWGEVNGLASTALLIMSWFSDFTDGWLGGLGSDEPADFSGDDGIAAAVTLRGTARAATNVPFAANAACTVQLQPDGERCLATVICGGVTVYGGGFLRCWQVDGRTYAQDDRLTAEDGDAFLDITPEGATLEDDGAGDHPNMSLRIAF